MLLLTMFTLVSIKALGTFTLVAVDGLNTLPMITTGVLLTGR